METTKVNDYTILYGGLNTLNPPFEVGTVLRQTWRMDDAGNLVLDGREMVEFVGMRGDMMQLKTLNEAAAHSEDTVNPEVVELAKKRGFKPSVGSVTTLHYMYADRFTVIRKT